ncbi:NEURL1 [Branchiostoma lanceolatum]|uniref:NEURL1 protein n=1 Tax=Branchiostoma lanceolatum TaxID=7740 RepID=A0A8K0AJG1_BRALA|nr:NEURL1 [Branchiostoma lanceolatum]
MTEKFWFERSPRRGRTQYRARSATDRAHEAYCLRSRVSTSSMPNYPDNTGSKPNSLYPPATEHSDTWNQHLSKLTTNMQQLILLDRKHGVPSLSCASRPVSSDIWATMSTGGSSNNEQLWKKDTHNGVEGNKGYDNRAAHAMSWLAARRRTLEMARIKNLSNPEWVLPNRRIKHVDFVDPSGSFLHIHSKFNRLGINLLCPCGFHDVSGKRINLETSDTGHKTTALYMDSSYSLQDGLVFLSHPLRTDDTIVLRIKRVDRRMSILYMCLTSTDPAMLSPVSLPAGRQSPNFKSPVWCQSDVLHGLKSGDHLFIRLTDEGNLYCQRNDEEERFILHVFDLSQHLWLGLCLSIGIRKVQLVGLIPREAPVPRNTPEDVHVDLGRKAVSCLCHVCNKNVGEKVVFTCGHVRLCPSCEARLWCRMCGRPMCRSSCPICTPLPETTPSPQVDM